MSVTTRQAIMTVSRQLLEAVLPPGVVIDCYADKVGALDYGTLERPLLLPADARVTGVCVSGECFRRDQVLIRVACSAFREVELSDILPDVQAHYERTPHGPRFVGWSGGAVGTPLGQPAGVPLRTVLEPWEKALLAGNFDYAPVMDAPSAERPTDEDVARVEAKFNALFTGNHPDGTCMQYQLPIRKVKELIAVGPLGPDSGKPEPVAANIAVPEVSTTMTPTDLRAVAKAVSGTSEPESATLDDVRLKVAYVPCDGGVLLPDFEAERLLRDYGKPDDEPKPVKFREFL